MYMAGIDGWFTHFLFLDPLKLIISCPWPGLVLSLPAPVEHQASSTLSIVFVSQL